MPPRRLSTFILLIGFSLVVLFLYATTENAVSLSVGDGTPKEAPFTSKLPKFNVPSFHFSYRKSSHKPQDQRNSTSGGSSWYSDWAWLHPFSSSITLDENRSVLPPLVPRPPVYTYYDPDSRRDYKARQVDQLLLSTWQRAWWAHGFRPVILGKAEARNNPLYERMQGQALLGSLQSEVDRWLAWGHMGTGLLTSWHCVPMGSSDDPFLSYLRRGQYPILTRLDQLGAGFFAAEKAHINDAMQESLFHPKLESAKTILEILNPERLKSEAAGAVACYDSATVKSKYPALAGKMEAAADDGRLELNAMINSHLHSTWQNIYTKGIAVLKPLPGHTTALITSSLQLANLLAQCPESVMPSSCPPNRPNCSPCISSRFQITTPSSFRNSSLIYPIGTVPHPYTMISLHNQSEAITVKHIRRYTNRDPWLMAVTRDILGSGRGGPSRVVGFKEAVGSDHGRGRGLWLTAEEVPVLDSRMRDQQLPEEWLANLDWHFGFPIPRAPISHGESIPPVPGPERWPKSKPGLPVEKKKSYDPDPPTEVQLAIEAELIDKAKRVVSTKDIRLGHMRAVAEAWNLADTEAWRFARAYQARSVVERLKWQEEESGYGTEGRGRRSWWRR